MTSEVIDFERVPPHDDDMTTTSFNTSTSTQSGSFVEASTGGPPAILRRVFWLDRAIAVVSGVGLIVFSSFYANQFAWPMWVVAAIGAVLLPYSAVLHWIVSTERHSSGAGFATMVVDVAWVAGSIALIATLSPDATAAAPWLLGAQALIIADVALAKLVGFVRKGA